MEEITAKGARELAFKAKEEEIKTVMNLIQTEANKGEMKLTFQRRSISDATITYLTDLGYSITDERDSATIRW